MNFYEENMQCIKANRKYLYNQLEKSDGSSFHNKLNDIESVDTRDGNKAVIIHQDSKEYRLNSIYRPVEEAKKWVEQYKFNNVCTVISMFGFGNGIFSRTILDSMGDDDVLFIYEPCPEIFLHVLENYDITDILSNKKISISIEGINEYEFHSGLRGAVNISNIKTRINCIHPQYDKIFMESCIVYLKELKDNFNYARMNINTEMRFAKKSIDNMMDNMKFIYHSNTLAEIKQLIPSDMTAIVVAAGPSVEENIEELKKVKGRVVIIAVDRILDYLLDSGVEPDLIVTLDPMKSIKYFTKREDIRIPLICFMHSNSDILQLHMGRKIIGYCGAFLDEAYIKNKKIPPKLNQSGSVATVAFSACIEMGIKKIILVGQDLAFSGDKSHAGDMQYTIDTKKETMVEGISGEPVKSRVEWKEFITWYQDMLTIHPELQVIDAKIKGAKIKGTKVLPLKEAIDKYCNISFDIKKTMEDMNRTFNEDEINNISKYLEDNLLVLNKIDEKAGQAIDVCNILIKENTKNKSDSSTAQKANKKLSKINRYIERQPIYSLMDSFITTNAAQHLSEMYQFTDDNQTDSIKTYNKSIMIYKAAKEAVDYIKPRLEKAINEFNKE